MDTSVEKPIQGAEAFDGNTDSHVMSQAAVLLLLARRMGGDDRIFRAQQQTFDKPLEDIPDSILAEFRVPEVRWQGNRVRRSGVQGFLRGRRLTAESFAKEPADATYGALVRALYQRPDAGAAAALFEACLTHPHPLTRVSAAFAYHPFVAEQWTVADICAEGLSSGDPLIREVAATALAQMQADHPSLQRFAAQSGPGYTTMATPDSFLVHGTFARNAPWWQPGGDFFDFVRHQVRPALYGLPDRYDWSGGYSDGARATAAKELINWTNVHGLPRPDIFAHSHGGNVCNLATQAALAMGTLVLLSCPVHPSKYLPDISKVNRVVSIRVKLDLVILADRGGQSFRGVPGIEEHVLPIWFNHSASHDPAIWTKHNVKQVARL